MLFAYLTETILPLTSILAGIAGVFMMFGQRLFNITRLVLRLVGVISEPKRRPIIANSSLERRERRVRFDGKEGRIGETPHSPPATRPVESHEDLASN